MLAVREKPDSKLELSRSSFQISGRRRCGLDGDRPLT